jgi:hypothetical protein
MPRASFPPAKVDLVLLAQDFQEGLADATKPLWSPEIKALDLSQLHSKQLTKVMKGEFAGMKVPRPLGRQIRRFRQLPFQEQRAELWRHCIYTSVLKEEGVDPVEDDNLDAGIHGGGSDEDESVDYDSEHPEEGQDSDSEHMSEASSTDSEGPKPVPPLPKRQRIDKKGGNKHAADNLVCYNLKLAKSSRASRELKDDIYDVDLGSMRHKPETLVVWGDTEGKDSDTQLGSERRGRGLPVPSQLYLIEVRETGLCKYSGTRLRESPSALFVMDQAETLEKAKARSVLLHTPSHTLEFPEDWTDRVLYIPEEKNSAGVDPCDGNSECSYAFAYELGLIPCLPTDEEVTDGNFVYDAWQIRGIMPVRINGVVQVVEVKAMLFLNCCIRRGMVLPESCAKLVGEPHLSSMVFGLDIAKYTDRPMCPPKANPSFLSMMHFRLHCITDTVARADALKKLSDWCGECRKLAEDSLPFKAWGLPGGPPKPREPLNSRWLFGEEGEHPDIYSFVFIAKNFDVFCDFVEVLCDFGADLRENAVEVEGNGNDAEHADKLAASLLERRITCRRS